MKCYYHPDLDSANACSVCSRFLCPSCSHRVKGRFFCQDCLVQGAELAALARTPTLANYSPSRAAFFGLIPGIGAVYNRQYVKAVTHFGIFAGLVILADEGGGIFGFAAFAFYIFTIIDAYRSAQGVLRHVVADPTAMQSEEEEVKLPLWGSILVLLGVLFFLDNIGALSLRSATHFAWPLVFVATGLYMIFYYLAHPTKSKPPMPPLQDPPGYPPPFNSEERGPSSATDIAGEGS